MIWALAAIILIYGLVVFRGAPYLNSHKASVENGLDAVKLGRDQTLIDLGSGSGNILAGAARRGAKAIGYELNPLLVIISRLKLRRFNQSTEVIWGDYWFKQLPEADVIYIFTSSNFTKKLKSYLQKNITKPTTVLSYGYQIPGLKPVKTTGGYFIYQVKPVANGSAKP